MGKILIAVGIVCLIVGIIMTLDIRIPLGKLPGDVRIEKEKMKFYFPLTTSILLSILLSFVLYLVNRFWK